MFSRVSSWARAGLVAVGLAAVPGVASASPAGMASMPAGLQSNIVDVQWCNGPYCARAPEGRSGIARPPMGRWVGRDGDGPRWRDGRGWRNDGWREGRRWRDNGGWRRDRGWRDGRPWRSGRYYRPGSDIYFGLGLGLGVPAYRYVEPRRVYRQARGGNAHVRWCHNRYRSYRAWDNTFQPYNGPRQLCYSPYS